MESSNSIMKYEKFVQEYTRQSESISNIEENHHHLIQYWNNFVRESVNFSSGVFEIDIFGIYTPIQDNNYGVIGFRGYPFKRQRIFGLGDGNSSVYYKWNNFFVIFSNVIKTREGYIFRHIPIDPLNKNKEVPTVPCSVQPITLSIPSRQEQFFEVAKDFKDGSLKIKNDECSFDDDNACREADIKNMMKYYQSDSEDD